MALVELTITQAWVVVFSIPIVAFVSTILMDVILKRTEEGRLNSLLSFIMRSPQTLNDLESSENLDISSVRKQLLTVLGLVYTAIFLFLIVNILAEFYFVVGDATFPVTQGSTGALREVSKIVIETPWWSGWYGDLPWYNGYPSPLPGTDTFHNTWEWVLFTAFFVDNPVFLEVFISLLNISALIAASTFLLPLLLRRVRDSFIPSFFLLTMGIFTYIRPQLGLFAQAFAFQFEGETLQFGSMVQGGTVFVGNTAIGLMSSSLLLIILVGVIFVVVGGFLWKRHYPEKSRSHIWFMLLLSLGYVISFFATMGAY